MTQNEMIKAIFDDMKSVKNDVQVLKDDVQGLKDDVQGLKGDVQSMNTELQSVKNEVRGLQLTLENETNKNIRVIAEGHLDLNRKLDEALKAENEKEMLLIRMNIMENDMRKVKEKVGIA